MPWLHLLRVACFSCLLVVTAVAYFHVSTQEKGNAILFRHELGKSSVSNAVVEWIIDATHPGSSRDSLVSPEARWPGEASENHKLARRTVWEGNVGALQKVAEHIYLRKKRMAAIIELIRELRQDPFLLRKRIVWALEDYQVAWRRRHLILHKDKKKYTLDRFLDVAEHLGERGSHKELWRRFFNHDHVNDEGVRKILEDAAHLTAHEQQEADERPGSCSRRNQLSNGIC